MNNSLPVILLIVSSFPWVMPLLGDLHRRVFSTFNGKWWTGASSGNPLSRHHARISRLKTALNIQLKRWCQLLLLSNHPPPLKHFRSVWSENLPCVKPYRQREQVKHMMWQSVVPTIPHRVKSRFTLPDNPCFVSVKSKQTFPWILQRKGRNI